jgi:hypothetical protein
MVTEPVQVSRALKNIGEPVEFEQPYSAVNAPLNWIRNRIRNGGVPNG